MQKIPIYLQCDGVKAQLTDAQGNALSGSAIPSITRGMQAELELHLKDRDGNALAGVNTLVSFEFYLGSDYDPATALQLTASSGITVSNSAVTVPLTNTNTTALASAIGSAEEIKLHAELAGFASGSSSPALIVQFDLKVRNRVGPAGTAVPVQLQDSYLTTAQVTALVASKVTEAAPSINSSGVWVVNGQSTGVSATPVQSAATASAAGLMSAADKAKLDSMISGYKGYFASAETLAAAGNGSNGDFASVGSTDTIWAWDSDTDSWVNTGSVTVVPAWESITGKPALSIAGNTVTIGENSVTVPALPDSWNGSAVTLSDSGNYFTSGNVEGALQEIGSLLSSSGSAPAWENITGKPVLSITGNTVTIGENSVTVPALPDSWNGSAVTLSDSGNYFSSGNVEGALQEIGSILSGLQTALEAI